LLKKKGIEHRYRDYRDDPLTKAELKKTLKLLGLRAAEVLRRNDKAYKELGLTGKEPEARLIGLMAKHPTLLQRPIGIARGRAVLGRPIEALLDLA
jgi:arsenate reductase